MIFLSPVSCKSCKDCCLCWQLYELHATNICVEWGNVDMRRNGELCQCWIPDGDTEFTSSCWKRCHCLLADSSEIETKVLEMEASVSAVPHSGLFTSTDFFILGDVTPPNPASSPYSIHGRALKFCTQTHLVNPGYFWIFTPGKKYFFLSGQIFQPMGGNSKIPWIG